MFGMTLGQLITVIIIGAISGWIASLIMGSKGGLHNWYNYFISSWCMCFNTSWKTII